jgi:putative FmdB family regulatory protein
MIYDFKCEACGTVFEADVSINLEPKVTDCHNCGDIARRVFTDTPVSYWGDGWTKQRKMGTDSKGNLL